MRIFQSDAVVVSVRAMVYKIGTRRLLKTWSLSKKCLERLQLN